MHDDKGKILGIAVIALIIFTIYNKNKSPLKQTKPTNVDTSLNVEEPLKGANIPSAEVLEEQLKEGYSLPIKIGGLAVAGLTLVGGTLYIKRKIKDMTNIGNIAPNLM